VLPKWDILDPQLGLEIAQGPGEAAEVVLAGIRNQIEVGRRDGGSVGNGGEPADEHVRERRRDDRGLSECVRFEEAGDVPPAQPSLGLGVSCSWEARLVKLSLELSRSSTLRRRASSMSGWRGSPM